MSTAHETVPHAAPSHRWIVDPSHTSVGFGVRHMMITTVRGEFQKVSGTVLFDPRAPERAKVSASADVASISTREEKRDAHLRSADFFDAEAHPRMTFESTRVVRDRDGYAIEGELTIRGVARPLTLRVDDVTAEHTDPWGNRRIGASARGKIKRSDYGMTWNAALEAGGVLVGDEVTITIEASLIRQ